MRDLTGRAYLDVDLATAIDAGLIEGPTVRAAGLGLTITGGMATAGRHPLAAQFTLEEIRAGVDEAHRAGVKVAAHAHGGEGILNAIEGGVDTIEHGLYLNDESAARMAERGAVLVATLMNDMKYQEALERGLIPATALRQRQRLADEGFPVPDPVTRMAIARRHGVRVIAGTDAGGNALVRHGDNANEIVMLQRSGFSSREALAAATGHAAQVIGLPDRGRIAVGFLADLLVVNGDPTADVTVLCNPDAITTVIKGGRRVARGEHNRGWLHASAQPLH